MHKYRLLYVYALSEENKYNAFSLDIDECTTANGNCDHTCHNTNGSYYCTCNGGFFLLEDQRGCKGYFQYMLKSILACLIS